MVHQQSLENVVAHYVAHERPLIQHRRQFLADRYVENGNNLDIELCFDLWIVEQPIHARYFRLNLSTAAQQAVIHALRERANDLGNARTFNEIFIIISQIEIRGFREMGKYDISWYLAAQMGIEPEMVYLHRGTRVGARELGYLQNVRYVRVNVLSQIEGCASLLQLSAQEVENLLCDYHKEFGEDEPFAVKCFRCLAAQQLGAPP